MIVSLNEAAGMAAKAASGAGRPWGLAQEAGYAVSALEAMRLPGACALLKLLQETDGVSCERLRPTSTSDGVWRGEGPLCPLLTGAYIADNGRDAPLAKLENVHTPLLLVPFAGWALDSVQVDWAGVSIVANQVEAAVTGTLAPGPVAATVRITASPASNPDAAQINHSSQAGPVDIADEIWEGLSALAHRTYVPATEASRLKGAGAGLTDND